MTPSHSQQRPGRRRLLACTECRRKKLRCNHQNPCNNCQRSRTGICSYSEQNLPSSGVSPTQNTGQKASRPTDPAISKIEGASGTLESPSEALWHDSEIGSVLLAQESPATLSNKSDNTTPKTMPLRSDNHASGQEKPTLFEVLRSLSTPVRALVTRSRYMMSSHWVFAVILHPQVIKWLNHETVTRGECWKLVQECKFLGNILRTKTTPQKTPGQYGHHLPGEPLAGRLLDLYLQTFETVYRIIHIPTLKFEYEAWSREPNHATIQFIIQFQLCLALGASIYDDTFSLRTQAMQWISEAEDWLASGDLSTKSTVPRIQIMCLLHLSKQTKEGLWGDKVLVSAAGLIPAATCIGLHRDPSRLPAMPAAVAEMRRRLWATILELSLDAAVDAGQTPLVSASIFDCEPPSNLDDDQLDFGSNAVPTPRDYHHFTQTSVQIALRRSFTTRLEILNYTNALQPTDDYQDVLKHSSALEAARRQLATSLEGLKPHVSHFQRHYCQMIMSRYIFALHIPYVPLPHPEFLFLRKTCVDAAFSLCYSALSLDLVPPSHENPLEAALIASKPSELQSSYFKRLLACGAGSPISAVKIAINIVGAELHSLLTEDMLLADNTFRRVETRLLLRAGLEWAERRLRAAQYNDAREYSFISAMLAGNEAIMENKDPDEMIAQHGLKALTHASRILGDLSGDQSRFDQPVTGVDMTDLPYDSTWDFWGTDFSTFNWVKF